MHEHIQFSNTEGRKSRSHAWTISESYFYIPRAGGVIQMSFACLLVALSVNTLSTETFILLELLLLMAILESGQT